MSVRRLDRRKFGAGVALTGAAALLTACGMTGDGIASDGEDSGDDAAGAALRIGPLQTQNTLTLALDRVEESVQSSGGEVEVVSQFPAFAPAAEAMLAGQVDMTSASSTALVTALGANPDLVVFAVERNDNDTQGIVAAAGSDIETIEDLRGRSVAVNEGGTGDYILRRALTSAGMSIDDVELVYLGPADAATAFSAGQVDAWATWDQYLVSAAETEGATLVTVADEIGARNPTIHVTTRTLVEDHPEAIVATYEALQDQAEAVLADPAILRDAYVEDGAAPEVADALITRTPPTIVPADADYLAGLTDVAEFYADQGLTDEVVDVSGATVDITELG